MHDGAATYGDLARVAFVPRGPRKLGWPGRRQARSNAALAYPEIFSCCRSRTAISKRRGRGDFPELKPSWLVLRADLVRLVLDKLLTKAFSVLIVSTCTIHQPPPETLMTDSATQTRALALILGPFVLLALQKLALVVGLAYYLLP